MIKKYKKEHKKGCNQGCNFQDATNLKGCNMEKEYKKQASSIFISKKESCSLLSISRQALEKRIKKGEFITREVYGNGGLRYELLLASFSIEIQKQYFEKKYNELATSSDMAEKKNLLDNNVEIKNDEAFIYASLEPYNRAICDRNLLILDSIGERKGKEAEKFITEVWNKENPDTQISYKSFERIKLAYKKFGISGICGKYGKKKGKTKIKESWWHTFMSIYAGSGSMTSVRSCWEIVCGSALEKGEIDRKDEFPSFSLFAKRVKEYECTQALNLIRHGKDYWKQHHSFSIDIDESSYKAGDVFVGDHAKFDVLVALPDASMVRAWITAICDYKSKMILGYDIFYTNPNGDKIILSLKRAFEKAGIPKILLFDNGKDYRRKDIGGGRITKTSELIEASKSTIAGILNIEMHYAIPYNSQSKPIERIFGIFREYFDKHITGYAGSDGKDRPDTTRILEKKMVKIKKEISEENLKQRAFPVISFNDFKEMVEEFIEIYNKRAFITGKHAGKSPIHIWNEDNPSLRAANSAELGILCASSGDPARVNRNCLRDTRSGNEYFSSWMIQFEGTKKRFFLRIDPEKPNTAYCFEAKIKEYNQVTGKPIYELGKFINTANIKPKTTLWGENKKILEDQLEIKKSVYKQAKRLLKDAVGAEMSVKEKFEYMKTSVFAEHLENCEIQNLNSEIEKPESGLITPFSYIPDEIEKEKNNGIWDTSLLAETITKEKKSKHKFVRFSDIKED